MRNKTNCDIFSVKPKRTKHDSGYRHLHVKTTKPEEVEITNHSDAIQIYIGDALSPIICIDSEKGELRFFNGKGLSFEIGSANSTLDIKVIGVNEQLHVRDMKYL